jgi:hypothetical protein
MLTIFLGIPAILNKKATQDGKAIAFIFCIIGDVLIILSLTNNI